LDGNEIKWVDMMKMILNAKPEIIKIPNNRVSKFLHHFTKSGTRFDNFIMACIILNMLQLMISFEGEPRQFTTFLFNSNYFFTVVFSLEALLKIIGNGWGYFIPTWNKFDFFVVVSGFADILLSNLTG